MTTQAHSKSTCVPCLKELPAVSAAAAGAVAATERRTPRILGSRGARRFGGWAFSLLAACAFVLYAPGVFAKDPPAAAGPALSSAEAVPPASAWKNLDGYEQAAAAAVASQIGKYSDCVDKAKASLDLEEHPQTRLLLSGCEMHAGKLIDALTNSQKVLKGAQEQHDDTTADFARKRSAEILPRIPHLGFFIPPSATDLKLTFDGRLVPTEGLAGKRFAVDPGSHTVHAEATINGVALIFDKTYELHEGQFITAAVQLVPQSPEFLSSGQLNCVLTARNQVDVFKCLPQGGTNLVVRAGAELSGYTDTDHVEVVAPRVSASVVSPTSGWNVAGSFLVDVVSAASPDIVSEASPPFHEMREAGTLSAGYKPGLYGVQGNAHVSSEPDYLSEGGGVELTADLNDKLITPQFSYDFSADTIGREGAPFSVFHHNLLTHDFGLGVTFIMDPKTILLVGGSLELERGDQSKPYRYIPMFSASVAPLIPAGASVDLVNASRLPVRSLEQLPLARDRYAVGARVAHRFKTSTLRLEERLYRDSWEQMATTTDLKYMVDIGKNLLVWPHLRFNLQNGADFYKKAYVATINPNNLQNSFTVPAFRTDDRESSPLYTGVFGLGTRLALSESEASTQFSVTFQGDVMYNHYFDALFITSRTAIYGTLSFDAEFQ